jgi:hypothetical protein
MYIPIPKIKGAKKNQTSKICSKQKEMPTSRIEGIHSQVNKKRDFSYLLNSKSSSSNYHLPRRKNKFPK